MKALKFRIGYDKRLSAAVQDLLFTLGYRWGGARPNEVKDYEIYALFTSEQGLITWNSCIGDFEKHKNTEVDWVSPPNPDRIFVQLNDNYGAEVYKNGKIKVGCQTFDFDAVDRLSREIKRFKDIDSHDH